MIPYPIVWCLDWVLFVSEPVWQIMEALGIVHLSMELSQEAADHIDDQPKLVKGVILSICGISYSCFLYLLWCIISTDYVVYIWAAVLILIVTVIVHIMVINNDTGILSDAAVVGACSMALLYDVSYATASRTHTDVPPAWSRFSDNHSYSQMIILMVSSGLGSSGHSWQYLSHMLSPWFLLMSLARVCCIVYAVGLARILLNKLTELSESDEDQLSYDEGCDLDHPVALTFTRSPLLIKLVVIFVYAQFLVCHVTSYHHDNTWFSWLHSCFPSGRWVQIVLLNGYYIYRLCKSDAENI